MSLNRAYVPSFGRRAQLLSEHGRIARMMQAILGLQKKRHEAVYSSAVTYFTYSFTLNSDGVDVDSIAKAYCRAV